MPSASHDSGTLGPPRSLADPDPAVEIDLNDAVLADELHGVRHRAITIAEARHLPEPPVFEAEVEECGIVGVLGMEECSGHGGDRLDLAVHQPDELVEGVDARRHQHAAAGLGREVPGLAVCLHPQLDEAARAGDRPAEAPLGEDGAGGEDRAEELHDMADHQEPRCPGRRRLDLAAERDRRRHRLLEQDVTPGGEGRHGDLGMAVVGGRDHHRRDGGVVEERAPVAVGGAAVGGGEGLRLLPPAAADGDKARVRLARDRRGVDGAEVAGADDADSDGHAALS